MKMFEPELRQINCPLCGTQGAYWRTIRGWKVDKCSSCAFVFPNPMPTEETMIEAYALPAEEYHLFFQSEYLDLKILEGEPASWQMANTRQYLRTMEQLPCSGRKLLEIGCSSGFFLAEAQRQGWQTQGVDPGQWGTAERDAQLGIQRCSLFEADIAAASLDVVFIASVVEHLTDPLRYMRKIYSLLKPGGVLYIVGLPNLNSAAILLGIDKWVGNHPPIHLGYYTPATAVVMLEQCGFSNVQEKTYGISETILEAAFGVRGEKYSGSYTNLLLENTIKGQLLKRARDAVNVAVGFAGIGSVMELLAKRPVEGR